MTQRKALYIITAIVSFFMLSCKNTTGSAGKPSDAAKPNSAGQQGFYFDYILDGIEMHTDAADIFTQYYPYKHNTFTIYAGKEDSVMVLLNVCRDIRKPSVTPSGSSDPKMNLPRGSISLQDYPKKNTTCISYNKLLPAATPIMEDAIIITGSEKEGDTARIITGSFHAKTYSDNTKTQNQNTEHVIRGKFRIRHEFHSYNGGTF